MPLSAARRGLIAALVVIALARSSSSSALPSFVFLLCESLDGRLLREGSAAKIPNIRALISAGSVRWDSAYANSPVCAPSRSSLISGRAPHKIPHVHNGIAVAGAWNNAEGLDSNYSARLDQLLSSADYSVSLAGKTDWLVGGHTETVSQSAGSSVRSCRPPRTRPMSSPAPARPLSTGLPLEHPLLRRLALQYLSGRGLE